MRKNRITNEIRIEQTYWIWILSKVFVVNGRFRVGVIFRFLYKKLLRLTFYTLSMEACHTNKLWIYQLSNTVSSPFLTLLSSFCQCITTEDQKAVLSMFERINWCSGVQAVAAELRCHLCSIIQTDPGVKTWKMLFDKVNKYTENLALNHCSSNRKTGMKVSTWNTEKLTISSQNLSCLS